MEGQKPIIENSPQKSEREPKYRGTGIDVHHQPIEDLVKGDTFFDADFGSMVWDGEKWVSEEK